MSTTKQKTPGDHGPPRAKRPQTVRSEMSTTKQKTPGDHGPPRAKRPLSDSERQAQMEEKLKARNLKLLGNMPEEEKRIDVLVFGGEDQFVDKLLSNSKIRVDPSADLLGSDSDGDDSEEDTAAPSRKPAWEDEEDKTNESVKMTHRYRKDVMKSESEKTLKKEQLQTRLQQEFQKAMGGVPSWASREPKKRLPKKDDSDEDDEDDEDNLLSKTGNLLAKSTYLPKGILQIKRCANANRERSSDAPLTTVQFHPLAQVVMTAGLDRSVSLFQVDGKLNPKIQSIYLEKFPVFKARFSADGEKVIATGMGRRNFYIYDMMSGDIIPVTKVRGLEESCFQKFDLSSDGSFLLFCGSSGNLHLLSMKTKEKIGSMKMNAGSAQAMFSPDCSKIFSTSDAGEVYVWDVKSRRCLNRFVDDGSICGTSLAISKDGKYVSCGSSSGVVNVYNYDDCLQGSAPKPLKSIMNLVTTASSQVFSANTQMLAIASHAMDSAVKLIHIPSFSVFSNFPVQSRKTGIYFPRAMDFSPHSGYFSIANSKGEALLYRLKHYSDF